MSRATETSSVTSRRTAVSSDSPASTKPATSAHSSVGPDACRTSSSSVGPPDRPGRVIAASTAGESRSGTYRPQSGQRRAVWPGTSASAARQAPHQRWVRRQVTTATARPASVATGSGSSAASARQLRHRPTARWRGGTARVGRLRRPGRHPVERAQRHPPGLGRQLADPGQAPVGGGQQPGARHHQAQIARRGRQVGCVVGRGRGAFGRWHGHDVAGRRSVTPAPAGRSNAVDVTGRGSRSRASSTGWPSRTPVKLPSTPSVVTQASKFAGGAPDGDAGGVVSGDRGVGLLDDACGSSAAAVSSRMTDRRGDQPGLALASANSGTVGLPLGAGGAPACRSPGRRRSSQRVMASGVTVSLPPG